MENADSQEYSYKVEAKVLQKWIDHKIKVSIFLKNGIALKGIIKSFDKDVIMLLNYKTLNNVHKQAISTIVPIDKERSDY